MSADLHKEHRKRVRKEFLEHGFADDVAAHKLLEMLLFFSIPRKVGFVNKKRLCSRWHSLFWKETTYWKMQRMKLYRCGVTLLASCPP